MQTSLPFDSVAAKHERLGDGATLLRRFALTDETALLADLAQTIAAAPFRHMVTAGGYRMSVAMTNCGDFGWISDRKGYRYSALDPESGEHWPAMPRSFQALAQSAAARSGYAQFNPDACLINHYEVGARLTLHRDENEVDFTQPIVSVSLGIPAILLFGGLERNDKAKRIPLAHGDVVVWGGKDRMRYHGILPIKALHHPLLGSRRINLTFRKAT